MKSSIAWSLLIHVGLTSILVIGGFVRADVGARPVVYRVALVEPRLVEPAAVEEAPAVEETSPAPEPVVVTEPPPEPATESPEVPREVPALERQPRRPAEARVRAPEKAAPQPLATEEPEPRRRRVETAPAATPPPASEAQAAAPDEAEPAEQPRGKSTQVSADEPEFVRFAYYQVAMRNKISSQWSPPRASEALVCTVHFRIVRSGAVVAARVVESSGLAFFDHTALRAVIESSPLPPLPAEFPGDVVGVTFEFAYKP